jgi:TonB family protein
MPRLLSLALLVAVALPAGVRAEEPPAQEIRRSENPLASAPPPQEAPKNQLTKAPELLQFVEAAFPEQAKAEKLTGAVGLLVDLDAAGAVTKVEVAEPAGHGFDEAAVEAVRQFKFSPAEIDGQPAPVRIGYRYSFVMRAEEPVREERKSVVNFKGVVLQRGNRAPVQGANVSVGEGDLSAVTDAVGRFEIADVPLGKVAVAATASGYEVFKTEEELVEGKLTSVTYYLRQRIFSQYETVVRGKKEKKEVARVELQQEEIRLIPGTQGDAFKVVQNLPGVARSPYGFGVLIVRGGRPYDTKVYLDGVWVPILFHFGGLTAIYNSDLLSDITYQPGNFGGRYGRAIAGAVEGETRAGSKQAWHGYLNASAIDSSALVEGPLSKDWSVAAAGRGSYVDLILKQVLPAEVKFVSAPRYFDYQLKADYGAPGARDQARVMLFGSSDAMKLVYDSPASLDPEGRSEIGESIVFHRLMGSWTHAFSGSLRNKVMAALGVDLMHGSLGGDIYADTRTNSLQVREALTWELVPQLTFEVGADIYANHFFGDAVSPTLPVPGEIPDPIASHSLQHYRQTGEIFEPGVYAEAVYKPFEGTRIVPTLRFDYESYLKYAVVDPRLAVFQQVGATTLLKGGLGIYHQAPDYRAAQWTAQFGNPYLGPEKAVQSMLGVEQKITDALGIDLQLYYKRLTQLSSQSWRVVERDGKLVQERWANTGEGHSYGLEVLLRHELSRNFFGWIAYSWSRSTRRNTISDDPNYYLSQFDQPHHVVVVASYKWPDDWITGVRFQYSSGTLLRPVQSALYDADGDLYIPVPKGGDRVRNPDFLALDIRVDKRFVFKDWMIAAYLDIQNVTNNMNPEAVLYNYDYSQTQYLRGLPIFPSIGVKAEF